ncbi:MAG: GDP-L-fucose synthase, partial [Mucinivorans sp.]
VFVMENYDGEQHVNIGSGNELSIKELSQIVRRVVGYTGAVKWNTEKPDGMPRKLMDCSKLHAMGWAPKIELEDGIAKVYAEHFIKNQ